MISGGNMSTSKMMLMLSYEKMPTLAKCDFFTVAKKLKPVDDGFFDWFIPAEKMKDRKGRWFAGVASFSGSDSDLDALVSASTCEEAKLTKDKLTDKFDVKEYEIQVYVPGCYYFDTVQEEWISTGLTVSCSFLNTTVFHYVLTHRLQRL